MATDIAIACPLTEDERRIVDQIRAAGRFTNDVDVVKVAVWRLAEHLGIACPDGALELWQPPSVDDATAKDQPSLFDQIAAGGVA